MQCSRPASSSTGPLARQRDGFEDRVQSLSAPRRPCRGVDRAIPLDGVAPLAQLSASNTLKALPAKLHHAATDVDREDNPAPGTRVPDVQILDVTIAIRQPHLNSWRHHKPASFSIIASLGGVAAPKLANSPGSRIKSRFPVLRPAECQVSRSENRQCKA